MAWAGTGDAGASGAATMMKSLSMATGLFSCLVGLEMLLVDSAVILPLNGQGGPRVVTAPDWAPWTLLSLGAVTVMHFLTLPRPTMTGQP
jgi:hypothetical protein